MSLAWLQAGCCSVAWDAISGLVNRISNLTGRIYIVNGRKLRVEAMLSEGGFSTVYKVREIDGEKVFALKVVLAEGEEELETALREIRVYRKVNHGNLLKLYDSAVKEAYGHAGVKEILMLMPYFENGSLQAVLDDMKENKLFFSEIEVLQILLKVCRAVRKLNQCGFSHRDVCPDNIYTTSDMEPTVGNFSTCAPVHVPIDGRQAAITLQEEAARISHPEYRAPELYEVGTLRGVDCKSDVWSCGCVGYSLAFGESLFSKNNMRGGSVSLAVLNGGFSFPRNCKFSTDFQDLLKRMLVVEPSRRASMDDVIKQMSDLLDEM